MPENLFAKLPRTRRQLFGFHLPVVCQSLSTLEIQIHEGIGVVIDPLVLISLCANNIHGAATAAMGDASRV
jgi:hypothetical protein